MKITPRRSLLAALTLTLLGDTILSLLLSTNADRIGRRRVLAASAGLMSDFGEFPIIQVRSGSRPIDSARNRYDAASFSGTISAWRK